MKVLTLSGGGFKGAFQVPIIKELLKQEQFDLILGVSVGAINGCLAAQDDLDVLDRFWDQINDRCGYNGVSGFLSLSAHRGKGFFSLRPLEEKVKKFISLDKIKTPFGCGATIREEKRYLNLYSNDMKSDKELHDAIIGSSAIAGLMEPKVAKINGERVTLSDGGHIHVLPLPTESALEITAIANFPLTNKKVCTRKVDGLFESISWAFEMSLEASHHLDLEILKGFSNKGASIKIFAPEKDLGSLIGASKEDIEERMQHGLEMFKKPIFL